MSKKYVGQLELTKKQWSKFMDRIESNSYFNKAVDIWLDEFTKVLSIDYTETYTPIVIQSEYGEPKNYFVRIWDINPTHSNPNTRYYIDDLYHFESLKPVLSKDRTNILKFIQNNLTNE